MPRACRRVAPKVLHHAPYPMTRPSFRRSAIASLNQRPARRRPVQDATLAAWLQPHGIAQTHRHCVHIICSLDKSFNGKCPRETPRQRSCVPWKQGIGHGYAQICSCFHWQDSPTASRSSYENVLVGQRAHAAAVKRPDPLLKLRVLYLDSRPHSRLAASPPP